MSTMRVTSVSLASLSVASVVALITLQGACANSSKHDPGPESLDDGGGLVLDSGGLDGSTPPPPVSCDKCTDFPAAPVFDGAGVPSNAPALFGPAGSGTAGAGPCLVEPEANSLFPMNWARPRFHFIAPAGQTLFEIRLHADREVNDLVVYTTSTTWTLPQVLWEPLASHVLDEPITMTIRGIAASGGTPSVGTSAPMTIAPVKANGSMVYWSTKGLTTADDTSKLQGFGVGDESVVDALTVRQVQMKVRGDEPATGGADGSFKPVHCIGCHTSTPDGKFAAFTAQWPWPNALASIEKDTVGKQPDFLTPAGASVLSPFRGFASGAQPPQKMLGIQTFSRAHWAAGDHIEIGVFGSAKKDGAATGVTAQLAWFDLEAASDTQGTGFGFLARTGDARSAAAPSWSHDGSTIVYVSTDGGAEDGRMGQGPSDLYTVPYASKAGGVATPIAGAAEPGFDEYYPAFSADDSLVAYNRIVDGPTMYNQPNAEVYVIPAGGGTATRLAANDPPACSGQKSPGAYNSWPKWSPEAQTVGGKTYHWVIFSSHRYDQYLRGSSADRAQLYVTAVVTSGTKITTYGAIYLWNQPSDISNHTPAWDVFKIPSVIK